MEFYATSSVTVDPPSVSEEMQKLAEEYDKLSVAQVELYAPSPMATTDNKTTLTAQASFSLNALTPMSRAKEIQVSLQCGNAEKYKTSIIAALMRTMQELLEASAAGPSKEATETLLAKSLPGTYVIRASESKVGQIALCTHIGNSLYLHEVLGLPEHAAERIYSRMTEAKPRLFQIQKKLIPASFQFYVPFFEHYVIKPSKRNTGRYTFAAN